jgi:DNA-binding MarR family transcriptional regulator
MWIDAVYQAYTNSNDGALVEALHSLRHSLVGDAQSLGPAAVALQLREHRTLTAILNKVEAEIEDVPAGRLGLLVGYINAYCKILTLMADGEAVDSAVAQLSPNRTSQEPVDLIRMIILKTAFARAGARAKEMAIAIERATGVKEGKVKFHLKKLVQMKLIERFELSKKAVSYRISHLGEAVLARRSKPYELAQFLVDQAVYDKELRAAMEGEIGRTWLQYEPARSLVDQAAHDDELRAAIDDEKGLQRERLPDDDSKPVLVRTGVQGDKYKNMYKQYVPKKVVPKKVA